jgi:isopenicillin-N N-acyltransferase-like protein
MAELTRRSFFRWSVAAPFAVQAAVAETGEPDVPGPAGVEGVYPLLEVRGSHHEIGLAIGRRFRDNILTVISRRREWHSDLLRVLASPIGRRRSAELMRLTKLHFPELLDEVRGMAEGAGIDFNAMWAMTIKSELGSLEVEPPGCSTLFYRGEDHSWLCHNEDGHAAYLDQMFLVRVTPPSGVRFVSMVYPGILTGNGPSLNSRGVIQTTNYIGSTRSEIGLPRYVIGRAILEAKSLEEARQIATLEPRAYPYHHNLASLADGRYLSVETVPGASGTVEPSSGLYVHTNHLLHEDTRGYRYQDEQYRSSSSMSRFEVLTGLAAHRESPSFAVDDLLEMLSSHERAPYSPCRHPRASVQGQTLGTAVFDLTGGSFKLARGNPCAATRGQGFAEIEA